jgi:hypothetical protein
MELKLKNRLSLPLNFDSGCGWWSKNPGVKVRCEYVL